MSEAVLSEKPCPHCSSMTSGGPDDGGGGAGSLGPLPSMTELQDSSGWVTGVAAHYRRLCSCARTGHKKAGVVSVAVVSTGITLFGGAMPSAADYYDEAYGSGSTSLSTFQGGSTYDEVPSTSGAATIGSYPNTPPPSVSNPPAPTLAPAPTPAAATPRSDNRNRNEATDDDRPQPPVVQATAPVQPVPPPVDTPVVTPTQTATPAPSTPGLPSTPPPSVSTPTPAPSTPTSSQVPAPDPSVPSHGYDEIPLPPAPGPANTAEAPGTDERDAPADRLDGPASRPMQFAPPKEPTGDPSQELIDGHQGTHFEPTPGAEYVDGIDGFLRMTGEHGQYILNTWKNGGGVVGPKDAEGNLPYRWFNDSDSRNFKLFQEFAYHHDMQATDAAAQGDGVAFTAANAGSAFDGMVVLMASGDLDAALAVTSAEFGLFGFTVRERYTPVAAPTISDVAPGQPTGPTQDLTPQVPAPDVAPAPSAAPAPLPSPAAADLASVSVAAPDEAASPSGVGPVDSAPPELAVPATSDQLPSAPTPVVRTSAPAPEAPQRSEVDPTPPQLPVRTEDGTTDTAPSSSSSMVDEESSGPVPVPDPKPRLAERVSDQPDPSSEPLIPVDGENLELIEADIELNEAPPIEANAESVEGSTIVEEVVAVEDTALDAAVILSPVAEAVPVTVEIDGSTTAGQLVGEMTEDGDLRLIVQSSDGTPVVTLLVPPPAFVEEGQLAAD